MLAASAVSVAKPSFISLIFPKLFITFPKHSTWLLFSYGAIKDKTSPLKKISYNRRIPKRVLTLTSTYIFHSQFLVSFSTILIPVLDISAWMTCLFFKLNLPQRTPKILLFFPNQPIPARFHNELHWLLLMWLVPVHFSFSKGSVMSCLYLWQADPVLKMLSNLWLSY